MLLSSQVGHTLSSCKERCVHVAQKTPPTPDITFFLLTSWSLWRNRIEPFSYQRLSFYLAGALAGAAAEKCNMCLRHIQVMFFTPHYNHCRRRPHWHRQRERGTEHILHPSSPFQHPPLPSLCLCRLLLPSQPTFIIPSKVGKNVRKPSSAFKH
jgi:hypothetical protein